MTKDNQLWYRVVLPVPPAESLPDTLKTYLGNQLWETDQDSLSGSIVIQSDNLRVIGFLEALAAMEVDGAEELLTAIKDNLSVVIWTGPEDPFDV